MSAKREEAMIYVTQLVYVHEGREEAFQTVEAAVLPLLAKYRGELVLRLRPEKAAKIGGSSELPYEVHVVRFETAEDLARYTADDERQRLLGLKDESVRSTVVIKGGAGLNRWRRLRRATAPASGSRGDRARGSSSRQDRSARGGDLGGCGSHLA